MSMKAVCHVCEQALEVCEVKIDPDSGIVGGGGFTLLLPRDPTPGKAETKVVSVQTGEVLRRLCNGSLRPPRLSVH